MLKLLRYEIRKIPFGFLLFCLLIVLTYKGLVAAAYYNHYNKEWRQTYGNYLAYTIEHNGRAAEKELNVSRANFSENSIEAEVIDTLLEQIKAREYFETVKKVARERSGFVFHMPTDFNKLRPVYASFVLPEIVNVLGYRLLVKLNEVNFMPIIIILTFSSFFSIESETGMKPVIRATGVGWDKILRSKLVFTIGINALLFTLFYIFDLAASLPISDSESMSKPYRSVIGTVLTDDSIGAFLFKYYIICLLYTVFLSCAVLLVSSLSKSSKLAYAINGLTYVSFLIVGTASDELGKATVWMTGNFINLYKETSLLVIPNSSLIIEQYAVFLLAYVLAVPPLLWAVRRS